jgi:hypothetical protein
MNIRFTSFLAGAALLVAGAAFAHHGTAISYDGDKSITVSGTVTKFVWANPHGQLFWDATEDGKTTSWGGELHSIGLMTRAGWTRNFIKPGDTVKVTGHPSRVGTPYMVVTQININGKDYFRDIPDNAQAPEGAATPQPR